MAPSSPVKYDLIWATQSHFPDEDQLFGYEPSSVDGDEPASGKENDLIN